MKKTEKRFVDYYESGLPEGRSDFASVEKKVDWDRYSKKKKEWWRRPAFLASCCSLAVAVIAVSVAVPLLMGNYHGSNGSKLEAGEYSLSGTYGEAGPIAVGPSDSFVLSSSEPSPSPESLMRFSGLSSDFSGYGYFVGGSLSEAAVSNLAGSGDKYTFTVSSSSWSVEAEMTFSKKQGEASIVFSIKADQPSIDLIVAFRK